MEIPTQQWFASQPQQAQLINYTLFFVTIYMVIMPTPKNEDCPSNTTQNLVALGVLELLLPKDPTQARRIAPEVLHSLLILVSDQSHKK